MKLIIFISLSNFCLYLPTLITTYNISCFLEEELRNECGYKGISQQECESKKCCFNETTSSEIIPTCFHSFQIKLTYLYNLSTTHNAIEETSVKEIVIEDTTEKIYFSELGLSHQIIQKNKSENINTFYSSMLATQSNISEISENIEKFYSSIIERQKGLFDFELYQQPII